MNDSLPTSSRPSAPVDHAQVVTTWLAAFEDALSAADESSLANLIEEDGHWRDVLAFTWHLTPCKGAHNIARGLLERRDSVEPKNFELSPERSSPRKVARLGRECIEAIYQFNTRFGRAEGVVRLIAPAAGESSGHKAWVLSTSLESLHGFEEKMGDNRPTGAAYSRNFGGDNWEDARRKAIDYERRDPTVLIVGGAQAGLSVAARLNQVGIDNLIVDKWPRIGDSWRKRYHSLALHNSTHVNHLPYLPFPDTWPTYIPKDMLAMWFEFYAQVMELNHWTGTEFTRGEWDEDAQRWTVTLKNETQGERVLHPRHIVFANGVSTDPWFPEIRGLDSFKGDVVHSEGFQSGAPYAGCRAVVIGTGSSANDIALDLHSFGCDTKIVQRGSTTVVSTEPSAKLNYALYDEGMPTSDCDLIAAASTPELLIQAYKAAVKRMLELDHDMVEGLKGIGFKFDVGDDETGHQMKYRRRGGGYNLDVGSSALMIKGEIGLLQDDDIDRYCQDGVLLKDGTLIPADLIVVCTGYYPQSALVERALGQNVAERIGQIWGEDEDGELSNMFKRTRQPGTWFIAGSLSQARVYSKCIALQIRALEEGLVDTDPFI